MKLYPNKNGKGYVTAYRIIIGTEEARRAGLLGPDGQPLELEKIIDEENKQIIIRIKADEEGSKTNGN